MLADASTVIQLDWGSVAAVATPIGAAIAAIGKFGWSALFGYLAERDTAKNAQHAVVVAGLTSLSEKMTELCNKVETVDEQNRNDQRQNNDRLIKAMIDNTTANMTQTSALTSLASRLEHK